MKTIRFAIWINILLYFILLSFSAWYLFKFVTAPRFPEIPNPQKVLFISFQLFFHSFPVLCIIGLVWRKNWGRILTLFTNIILSVGLIVGRVFDAIVLRNLDLVHALTTQKVFFSYIIAIPFIALTVILLNERTKSYF